ncbi:uncharacterized protein MELLADRAFT_63649 [Melampsora larici-populina 98AG31]|uniref:Uncharacterized protein n=1 Tax=Melampsora larici-populina (strain 98AG31 / pathotype 3-4-7) TaxID=747676 RepID=F4RNG2_MELLP|nr:uncharacterized protein MELLADRAFT_63649 [Melampsora larici-populina 98AG31]EGG06101.1 hypothetical protein MELLADRAFT_63649 [Melampsora larici-populina 98AG31]
MAQTDSFKRSHFPEGFGTTSGSGVTSTVKTHMRNHAMKNAKAELRIKLMIGVLPRVNVAPTIPVPEINTIHLKVHNYCVEKSKASTELEIGKVLKPEIKIRIILLRMQTLNSYKLSHPAKQSQWFHIDRILKEIRDENKAQKNVKYETAYQHIDAHTTRSFFKELLRRDATLFTGKTKYADYPTNENFAPPTRAEVIQILGE